jgi:hypothetical protein
MRAISLNGKAELCLLTFKAVAQYPAALIRGSKRAGFDVAR